MQHPHNPPDHLQIRIGDVQPHVERVDELGSDFFARVGRDVRVWLEQDLGEGVLADVLGHVAPSAEDRDGRCREGSRAATEWTAAVA
jgi:hypothetical protein